MKRVVVVGGGIAGLTAAYVLGEDPDREVVVLEGSPQVGGKLRLAEVGGVTVDVGAEAMLNRRPEGAALARELGLPVVHPIATRSQLWTRDALRPLPRSLMGVPLDVEELAASGVLSAAGLQRVRAEPSLPPTELDGDDVSVGDLVAGRLGEEVVDRLVEPLLGGVYAGHARELSARATTPQLVAMLDRGSLLEAAAAAVPVSMIPVFAGVPGGLGELPGGAARLGPVHRAHRRHRAGAARGSTGGYELVVGSAHQPERVSADEVVLAVPATPAARLLGDLAPAAAAELAEIEYASTAVVTLAFRAQGFPIAEGSSGFLVPPVEGRRIKASTFSFAKWSWVRAAGRGVLDGERRAAPADLPGPTPGGGRAPGDRRGAGGRLALRPRRRDRAHRRPGRRPGAALGRRTAAVRRRPPRSGRPDPGGSRAAVGAGGLRGGVRRGGHPRRHRIRPARGRRGPRGRMTP